MPTCPRSNSPRSSWLTRLAAAYRSSMAGRIARKSFGVARSGVLRFAAPASLLGMRPNGIGHRLAAASYVRLGDKPGETHGVHDLIYDPCWCFLFHEGDGPGGA